MPFEATCSKPTSKEVPLSDWAEANSVSHRTAQQWARSGKIAAKIKPVKRQVTRIVTTHQYVIRSNAKKPR